LGFTRDQQMKVGIFVVIGVAVMALSILFLGQDQRIFSASFKLRVQFSQTQGISRGSIVSLSGVRAGSVEAVEFAPRSQDLIVILDIDTAYKSRFTEGAIASVRTLGALGDRFIFITPGPVDGKPLVENSFLPTDESPDFFDVVAKKGPGLANIVDVIDELNQLLKNMNHHGRSAELMSNLVTTTHELKSLSREARDSMKHFSSVMTKIDRGDGTLGALVNDPSLHQSLLSFVGASPRSQFIKPVLRESIKAREKR
jgi:phospholipid/cholesterol/gamma-HCH transport system substrate-binding protein